MANQNHIKYRSDIDGFRALAVLSVLVFHFNNSWLPGGYLGVDVFFVISGYLITSIIKKQLAQGRFSFKVFYTRRIKRILPLLFLVLLVTLIPAVLILLPEQYENFIRSLRYAMQFRANRAFTGSDYFDVFTEEKPLLHLWSLAIEEQFYFIWPLVLFITFFLTKKFKNQGYILFLLAVLGILLSTVLAEISIKNHPDDSYYLLQNRAAELLVGCALALNPYQIKDNWKKGLGVVGTIVLVSCFIFYSAATPMPGIFALIPTIGAAFFILDNNIDSPYKRLFTNPMARMIGLWSFSLYLWHWPVLALSRYVFQDTELPLWWLGVSAVVILLLSVSSYYLVENPVRKTKLGFISSVILIFAIPYGAITLIYTYAHKSVESSELHIDINKTRWFADTEGCHGKFLNDCAVGDKTATTRYLLVGDSHAMHLSGMMDEIGKKEGIKIDIIASPACPVLFAGSNIRTKYPECEFANIYLENNYDQYDAVLWSQYYLTPLSSKDNTIPDYLDKFRNTLEIVSNKVPVIVFSDVGDLGYHTVRYERIKRLGLSINIDIDETRNREIQKLNQALKEMVQTLDNASYIDITPYVDHLLNDGQLIYYDSDHLNPYGSREIGKLFIQNQTLKLSQ